MVRMKLTIKYMETPGVGDRAWCIKNTSYSGVVQDLLWRAAVGLVRQRDGSCFAVLCRIEGWEEF